MTLEADVAVGMMNSGPDMDVEASINSSPSSNKDTLKANYGTRCAEISRFTGAGVQAVYTAKIIPGATTNLQVAAEVQVGSVIGNGAGLIFGLLLHYFLLPYYRTGEHEAKWVTEEPDADNLGALGIKAEAAYVRYEKRLFYVNKIMGELKELKLDDVAREKMEALYSSENIPKGGRQILSPKDQANFGALVPEHKPYNGRTSTNPLYRNFKTLANLGWQLGATIANFLGIQDPIHKKMLSVILSDVCCLLIGLIAIPYWLVREKYYKIAPNTKHRYALTGSEGWSKYARTAMAFGIAVGQTIGGLVAATVLGASAAAASFSIGFWGGLVGVFSFFMGLTIVPLVNWLTSRNYSLIVLADNQKDVPLDLISKRAIFLKRYNGKMKAFIIRGGREESNDISLSEEGLTEDQKQEQREAFTPPVNGRFKRITDAALVEKVSAQCSLGAFIFEGKNDYKNNYTRTGMFLFAGVFALIGLGLGHLFFGPILAAIIFSSIGTVVGGVIFTFISASLHRYMHPYPQGVWDSETKKQEAWENEKSVDREFQLYFIGKDIGDYDLSKMPNGLRTIVLKKEGNKIKAFWVSHDRLIPRCVLSLSIAQYEHLSERFDNMEENLVVRRSDERGLVDMVYDQSEDLDNSWDYEARSTAAVFSFIGIAIACLVNPAASLLLAPIGAAIAGLVGWFAGILIMKGARGIQELEPKAETLPWTMRIMTGATIGSVVGGVMGIFIGMIGFVFSGPASIVLAVSFFGAVGAVVGSIIGALYEPKAREMLWNGFVKVCTFGLWDGKPQGLAKPKPKNDTDLNPKPRKESEADKDKAAELRNLSEKTQEFTGEPNQSSTSAVVLAKLEKPRESAVKRFSIGGDSRSSAIPLPLIPAHIQNSKPEVKPTTIAKPADKSLSIGEKLRRFSMAHLGMFSKPTESVTTASTPAKKPGQKDPQHEADANSRLKIRRRSSDGS